MDARHRIRSTWFAALTVAVLGVAACGTDPGSADPTAPHPTSTVGPATTLPPTTTSPDAEGAVPPPEGARWVGDLLVRWSEEDVSWQSLDPLSDGRLIQTTAARDDFVALVDPSLEGRDLVASVDTDEHLLVAGSYVRCSQDGAVAASVDGATLTFVVLEPEPREECEWAPTVVEVWQVERAELTGEPDFAGPTRHTVPATGPGDQPSTSGPPVTSETAPPPAPRAVGELLAVWSEQHVDRALLEPLVDDRLVGSADELEAFVALVDPSLEGRATIADVDVGTHVVVVGAYDRCDETSQVLTSPDGATVELRIEVPDPPAVCVWAPLQVEVWTVARSELADEVALGTASDEDALGTAS